MKTLEDILYEYFDCKEPFLDKPYYDADERAPVVFTTDGAKAYGRLISLLYDIGHLTNNDTDKIVHTLEFIASEWF